MMIKLIRHTRFEDVLFVIVVLVPLVSAAVQVLVI